MALTVPVLGTNTDTATPIETPSKTYVTGQPIVIAYLSAPDTITITGVTDNGPGNTYTPTSQSPVSNTTNGYRIWFYTCLNPTGFTGLISAAFTGTPSFMGLAVGQGLGYTGTPTIDGETNAQSSSSTTPDPGTEALAHQSNVIIEASVVAGSDSAGTDYTIFGDVVGNAVQYKVVTNGTWGSSAFGGGAQSNWLTQAITIADVVSVTAALTGTATASITEADIVAGGKTIIATLTNDTYVVNTITPPVIEAADCTISGNNTAEATWAVSHPAASTGDLLIFYIAWDDSTTTTDVTEPAGPNSEVLSEINATPVTDGGTETRAKAWYTIATASWSASTRTFTPSATESWSATVIRVPAGEFDGATPIGTINTRTTAGAADTAALSPAMTAGASDGDGRLIWCAGVDADPLSGTVTNWTILQQQDLGAVTHGVAIRNAAVTDNESIAGGDTWTIAADSWTSIGFIVRAPATTPFENARQAFINGLDSGQAEGTGWDAVVKAGLATSTVVRTSSTVVTCTLSAFASYNITAQETITATIPASILTGAAPIVATPTFTVDTAGVAAMAPSVNETMGALVESVTMHMPIYVKMEKVP